jgi:hypothetical protein
MRAFRASSLILFLALTAACSTETDETAPGGLFSHSSAGGSSSTGGSTSGGRAGDTGGSAGRTSGGTGGTVATCTVPAWESGKIGEGSAPAYAAGTEVSFEGKVYTVDHDLTYAHEACPPAGPNRQVWCDGQYDYTYARDC